MSGPSPVNVSEGVQPTGGRADVRDTAALEQQQALAGAATWGGQQLASPPPSLVKKLCQVMAAMEGVAKTGVNKEQGYKFVRAADVLDTVRSALAQRHVMLFMSVVGIERGVIEKEGRNGRTSSFHSLSRFRFSFHDGESGEVLDFDWAGVGADSLDKDIWKSYTGALKTFLMKQFLMSEDDDPENDGGRKRPVMSHPYVASVNAAARREAGAGSHAPASSTGAVPAGEPGPLRESFTSGGDTRTLKDLQREAAKAISNGIALNKLPSVLKANSAAGQQARLALISDILGKPVVDPVLGLEDGKAFVTGLRKRLAGEVMESYTAPEAVSPTERNPESASGATDTTTVPNHKAMFLERMALAGFKPVLDDINLFLHSAGGRPVMTEDQITPEDWEALWVTVSQRYDDDGSKRE